MLVLKNNSCIFRRRSELEIRKDVAYASETACGGGVYEV